MSPDLVLELDFGWCPAIDSDRVNKVKVRAVESNSRSWLTDASVIEAVPMTRDWIDELLEISDEYFIDNAYAVRLLSNLNLCNGIFNRVLLRLANFNRFHPLLLLPSALLCGPHEE